MTERTQAFLNFLEKVQKEHRVVTKSKLTDRNVESRDITIKSPVSSEERSLKKKLNHLTKIVTTLEKSLTDRQEAVKAKHTKKPIDIEWSLSDEVSSELKSVLSCFDHPAMQNDVDKFTTSLNSYVSAESELSHQLQHNSSLLTSARKKYCDIVTIAAEDKSEYTLLEAEASLRLLRYKKHIASQLFNASNKSCSRVHDIDSNISNAAQGSEIQQDIEKTRQFGVEIEGLRCKLQHLVKKRLSLEKGVMLYRKQRDQIENLKELIASQRAILGDLEQQKIRYETALLSVEKDKTTVNNLRRRCDMIDKLLKNDADSTMKLREIHQFESMGDYSPSHPGNNHRLDDRDKLMICVKDVLMNGADIAYSSNNVTVDDLKRYAGDIKSSSDINIAKLANVMIMVQDTVRRTEQTFAELIDNSKGLDEVSQCAAIHGQFQIHQEHKRKVTNILNDLKMKIESRNGLNGVDESMKFVFAESERRLIDLYVMLRDECDPLHARELEKQIIDMLSTPLAQRTQED